MRLETDDERETWAERAAIREYCGGQERSVAEYSALQDIVRRRGQEPEAPAAEAVDQLTLGI